jgi:multiple sugar transport system permease protein
MTRQRKKVSQSRRPGAWLDDHLAQIFLIPSFVLIVGLIAYPAALTIYNSFTNMSMLTMKATRFVGFQNYATVLGGGEFWLSLGNSLVFTVGSISGQLLLGMIGALALQKIPFGRSAFRVGLLVPWTFPSVAMTFVWDWMLDSGFGIINYALMGLGIIGEPVAWFGSKTWAMVAVIVMNIWFGAPFMMLALNAGLQTIPADYYEVGKIEGANFFQRLWYIILPSLRKIVGVLLILRTIWVFNNYDFIFLTTGGGPAKATQTVSIMAYYTAWKRSAMGRGSAITILLLVFVAIMIALYFKSFKIDSEEA